MTDPMERVYERRRKEDRRVAKLIRDAQSRPGIVDLMRMQELHRELEETIRDARKGRVLVDAFSQASRTMDNWPSEESGWTIKHHAFWKMGARDMRGRILSAIQKLELPDPPLKTGHAYNKACSDIVAAIKALPTVDHTEPETVAEEHQRRKSRTDYFD